MCIVGSILVWHWLLFHRAQQRPAVPDDDEDVPDYENVSHGASGGMGLPDVLPAIGVSQVFRSKEFTLRLQD